MIDEKMMLQIPYQFVHQLKAMSIEPAMMDK